jgi:hypothetical protein
MIAPPPSTQVTIMSAAAAFSRTTAAAATESQFVQAYVYVDPSQTVSAGSPVEALTRDFSALADDVELARALRRDDLAAALERTIESGG